MLVLRPRAMLILCDADRNEISNAISTFYENQNIILANFSRIFSD